MSGHRSPRQIIAALAALALLAGCGNKVIGIPPEPPPPTAPPADSPTAAVQRLVWCWNQRDTTGLQDLFTADYVYSGADSTVSANPWFREQELVFSRHLFLDGTGALPPATYVTLVVDPTLKDEPDSRIGRNGKWNREVYTSMSLGVRTASGDFYATGHSRFFVVRGDSAKIPQVLKDRGVQPDSTRWWIGRWEDGTAAPLGTSAAAPASEMSFARVKALYLPEPGMRPARLAAVRSRAAAPNARPGR